MKMTEEEIAKLFFEFLRHMDNLTDVIESMARKMEEMDKRIKYLESQQQRKGPDFSKDDDEEWILA